MVESESLPQSGLPVPEKWEKYCRARGDVLYLACSLEQAPHLRAHIRTTGAPKLPRASTVAPAAPQKVNVSVDVPQNQPLTPAEPEEKSPMWFWDALQEVPKDKWGEVYDVMGFRLDPQAGRQAGAKGFLFQVFEPINIAWIKKNYGGGKFRCILEKNSKFFKSHEFDVDGPPIYDLSRERPNVPAAANGNGDTTALLQQFVTVLREELQHSREANSAPNPATDEAIGLVSRASEKAMDIVANRANAGGAGGNSTVIETIRTLKELGVLGGNQQKSLVEQVMELMTHPVLGPKILELFMPKDPLAQIAQLKSVVEVFDGLRGGSGGDGKPKDWRAMLAEGVIQKGPEFLRELRDIVVENKQIAQEKRAAAETIERVEQIRRGAAPANGAGAAAPGASPSSPMPSGPLRTVPIDRNAPADVGAPTPTPAAPQAAPGMSSAETDAVATFMQRRIVEMVNDERDAEDVVDFIEEIDPTMNDLLAQFSPEMVTTFLSSKPIIGDATRHPKWNSFLVSAQAYIKEIRAEDAAIEAASSKAPA
jgi:hypothetical protein